MKKKVQALFTAGLLSMLLYLIVRACLDFKLSYIPLREFIAVFITTFWVGWGIYEIGKDHN